MERPLPPSIQRAVQESMKTPQACILCRQMTQNRGVFVPDEGQTILGNVPKGKTRMAIYPLCKDHPQGDVTAEAVENFIESEEKRMNQSIESIPEWIAANEKLQAASIGLAVEFRHYSLPPGIGMAKLFGDMNGRSLKSLPIPCQTALRALATRIARDGAKTGTFAITRVETGNTTTPGLRIDDQRARILALAIKPGTRTFMEKLNKAYVPKNKKETQLYVLPMKQGPNTPGFLCASIPLEDRAFVEKLAQESQMHIVEEVPSEPVGLRQTGQQIKVEYPLQDEKNVLYLVNEPGSAVFKEPGAGDELNAIETMMLGNSEEE